MFSLFLTGNKIMEYRNYYEISLHARLTANNIEILYKSISIRSLFKPLCGLGICILYSNFVVMRNFDYTLYN